MVRQYDDATKREVMAKLLEGNSIRHVADEYGIPRGTVGNWSAKVNQAGLPAFADEKREEFGNKLLELAVSMYKAQMALLKKMSDEEYLDRQDLSHLSTSLGIINDKLDRLLSRVANASEHSNS